MRADAASGDARVQVGDALHLDGASDAEEDDAVEPIVGDAVGRMHRDRDEVVLLPQPAVEGERGFQYVAAPRRAQLKPALLRVRAIDVYAVPVANHEAADRLRHVRVETEAQANEN